MSKTIKKQSAKLKFDTSLNNLKCFMRTQSKNKYSQSDTLCKSNRRKTKQKYQKKKKIQFQDKDFISSVVCNVLNDANTQEITQLIDNMNFPTSGSSEKDINKQTPTQEMQHMKMKQIFNVQDINRYSQYTPRNQFNENIKIQNHHHLYYFSQIDSPDSIKFQLTPQKQQGISTFQSSLSNSFTLSPEQQKTYVQYNSYNYAYLYYQNSAMYRQQQKRRKNLSNQQSSQYKLSLQKIEMDGRTTIMIRHIPNKYSQDMLFDQISKNYKNKINFLYLPIDNYNQCNVGYAFVNFIHTKFIKEFYMEFSGRRWDKFNSQKICQLAYARIQGTNSLINHFENSLSSIKARKQEKKGKGQNDDYSPAKKELSNEYEDKQFILP